MRTITVSIIITIYNIIDNSIIIITVIVIIINISGISKIITTVNCTIASTTVVILSVGVDVIASYNKPREIWQ